MSGYYIFYIRIAIKDAKINTEIKINHQWNVFYERNTNNLLTFAAFQIHVTTLSGDTQSGFFG